MPVQAAVPADPFIEGQIVNPAPARARRAVEAAEQPLSDGPARAAAYAPADDDVVRLKQIEGQDILLFTIQDNTGEHGLYLDCLAACVDEPDVTFMLRIGANVKAKLMAARKAIEAGTISYPVIARFDEREIGGGKTFWSMS